MNQDLLWVSSMKLKDSGQLNLTKRVAVERSPCLLNFEQAVRNRTLESVL